MNTFKIEKTRNGETVIFRDRQSQDQVIGFLNHVEKQGFVVNFNSMTAKGRHESYKAVAEQ